MGYYPYFVRSFEVVGPYRITVVFEDGVTQTVDFEPVLHGEVLGPLRDLSLFNQVRLDPEIRNLVWPNDAAFDPEILHDWPQYARKFAELAQKWSMTSAVAPPIIEAREKREAYEKAKQ
jgi:hypothetical protein